MFSMWRILFEIDSLNFQFSVSRENIHLTKKERGNDKRFGSTLFKPFKRVITHKWSPGSENSASVFFY